MLTETVNPFIFSAITTLEGILQRTIAGLNQDQPVRRHIDPDGAQKIDDYVAKIEALLGLAEPFHVVRFQQGQPPQTESN